MNTPRLKTRPKKTKTPKTPKAGSLKRLGWELEQQGAFNQSVEDGEAFIVHGGFSKSTLQNFNNLYHSFHARPIPTVMVFKKQKEEDLRFGFDEEIPVYDFQNSCKGKDQLGFIYDRWVRLVEDFGSRYVAMTKRHIREIGYFRVEKYFYMDRVI